MCIRDRFEAEHPTRQKITKTDLAKYLNIWKYKPALVCKGVQKNFVKFSEDIDSEWKKNNKKYDETFFKELVAKTIQAQMNQEYASFSHRYSKRPFL